MLLSPLLGSAVTDRSGGEMRIAALCCLDHTPQRTRQVACAGALHRRNRSSVLDPNIGLSSRRVADSNGPGSKTVV